LHQVHQITSDGSTVAEACRCVGVDQATYSRWSARVAGIDWLANQDAALTALEPGRSTGRPCSWEALLTLDAARTKLDTIYLATVGAASDYSGGDRRTAKVATTLLRFAEEAECPPELSLKLRRGYQPAPFVRYLRRVTPELENRLRGSKHYTLHGLVSRRAKEIQHPDGLRTRLTAGFMVEFDDMSANQPFYVDTPTGVVLSRQGLYARDVASGRWLGVDLVARPREAYRAEDILRFLRRLMQVYGKFYMLRLERGVWRSRCIAGLRVTETGAVAEEELDRPDMDEDQRQLLQDGLAAIGVEIQYATSAHRKGGIEAGFHYLQTILATHTTDLQNIGRYGGEFEHGARQLRRVRAGSHHPAEVGFARMDVLADRIERSFCTVNSKPGSRGQPSPDDIWERDIQAHPLPQLQRSDMAVFLPDVRDLAIRHGLLTTVVNGRPYDFRAPDLVDLGTGYRVSIRFDATEPTLGAAIYNRETSSANHRGYRDGQFICWSEYEVPGCQAVVEAPAGERGATVEELYGAGAVDHGRAMRQAQLRQVRTAFRALPRPGQPAVRAGTVRDGRGNVIEAVRGALPAEPVSSPGASRLASQVEGPPRARFELPDDVLRAAVHLERARPASDADAIEELSNLFSAEPGVESDPVEF
jgi:hypothetical protein